MKKREEKKTPTLFDFIETRLERPHQVHRDVAEKVYHFVKSRGVVKKDELGKWAKESGFTTAELIKALEKLTKEKKIRKKLNDEGDLVYEAVA